ncbi:hypothetical protein [Dactylosporangium sp. NPDC051541]|uniref:hypothetical protein n=1 Tax=Dactylosporangium sp. NPDC051541 TaxID=3363977 RepID=UPI0037AE243D
MHEAISPAGMAPPNARFAHATLVTSPTRWLHMAGLVRPEFRIEIVVIAANQE